MTKLHLAVIENDVDAFKLALTSAVNSKKLNALMNGFTALHKAANVGNFPACYILISYGASVKATKAHKTAFDLALENKHFGTAILLAMQQSNVIDPAIITNLKVNCGYQDYISAILFTAISRKDINILRSAVKFIQKYTPEFVNDNPEIIQSLLHFSQAANCENILNRLVNDEENGEEFEIRNKYNLNDFQQQIYALASSDRIKEIEEFCINCEEDFAHVIRYGYYQNDLNSIKNIMLIKCNFHIVYNFLCQHSEYAIAKLLLINSFNFYSELQGANYQMPSTWDDGTKEVFKSAIANYLIDDSDTITSVGATNKFFHDLAKPYNLRALRKNLIQKELTVEYVGNVIDFVETELKNKKWWQASSLPGHLTFLTVLLGGVIAFSTLLNLNLKEAAAIENDDPNYQYCNNLHSFSDSIENVACKLNYIDKVCTDLCEQLNALQGYKVMYSIFLAASCIGFLINFAVAAHTAQKLKSENPSERIGKLKYTRLDSASVKKINQLHSFYKDRLALAHIKESSTDTVLNVFRDRILSYVNYDYNLIRIQAPAYFFRKPSLKLPKPQIEICVEEVKEANQTSDGNNLNVPLLQEFKESESSKKFV